MGYITSWFILSTHGCCELGGTELGGQRLKTCNMRLVPPSLVSISCVYRAHVAMRDKMDVTMDYVVGGWDVWIGYGITMGWNDSRLGRMDY